MLRKNKLDTTEKHLLLKEVKLSKAKRKQAEIETERHSLRSMLTNQVNSILDFYTGPRGVHQHATGSSYNGKTRSQPTDLVLEYGHIGLKRTKRSQNFLQSLTATHWKEMRHWVRTNFPIFIRI